MACKHWCIALLLAVLFSTRLQAQSAIASEESRGAAAQDAYQSKPITVDKMDKDNWQKLKKKLKIDDSYPEPEKKDTAKPKEEKNKNTKPNWGLSLTALNIMKWTGFLLITGLLLFFMLKILGINPFSKGVDRNSIRFSLEDIEENLDKVQIDPFIAEALNKQDYKLAIRLYYLMIIQKLSLKEKIIWKKYKTNKHYLNEMRSRDSFSEFKGLTSDYERIWFSNVLFNKSDYDYFQPQFVQYLHNIV